MQIPAIGPVRRPTPFTLALLAMIALVLIRSRPAGDNSLESITDLEAVSVARIIDGDTIELRDGRRVRLLGIDAPEMGFGNKQPESFANESTDWLRSQIAASSIRVQIGDQPTDRYGRTLAWIYDEDGELINKLSLEQGMSRLLDRYGLPPELEPELRQAAARARIRECGLWDRSQID